MTRGDIIGLVLSYIYAFGLLFVMEAIGERLKWRQEVTRKLIHIGAGMWSWGILALFDHWYLGIIPFGTFILLNYIFYRQQSFDAMDGEQSTPGTVYFAISITILFALLWRTEGSTDHVAIAAAAVMAMTWGDALASLVGLRWGEHPYTTFGHTRTWEGTVTMAVSSFVAILLTMWLVPGSALSPNGITTEITTAALLALVGAVVGTLAESLSPAGTDNLTVPLLTGAALYLVRVLLG